MAKVREGSLVASQLRGMVGDELVFRRRKGETIVTARPEQDPSRQPTAAQAAQQERFRQGAIYAQKVLAIPAEKADYTEAAEGTTGTAFSMAVRDFLNVPEVEDVDLSTYTGAVGSTITVTAIDDMAVTNLHVRVERMDGTLVEEGEAVQVSNSPTWVYTATVANPAASCKVTVTAMDKPGHTGSKSATK